MQNNSVTTFSIIKFEFNETTELSCVLKKKSSEQSVQLDYCGVVYFQQDPEFSNGGIVKVYSLKPNKLLAFKLKYNEKLDKQQNLDYAISRECKFYLFREYGNNFYHFAQCNNVENPQDLTEYIPRTNLKKLLFNRIISITVDLEIINTIALYNNYKMCFNVNNNLFSIEETSRERRNPVDQQSPYGTTARAPGYNGPQPQSSRALQRVVHADHKPGVRRDDQAFYDVQDGHVAPQQQLYTQKKGYLPVTPAAAGARGEWAAENLPYASSRVEGIPRPVANVEEYKQSPIKQYRNPEIIQEEYSSVPQQQQRQEQVMAPPYDRQYDLYPILTGFKECQYPSTQQSCNPEMRGNAHVEKQDQKVRRSDDQGHRCDKRKKIAKEPVKKQKFSLKKSIKNSIFFGLSSICCGAFFVAGIIAASVLVTQKASKIVIASTIASIVGLFIVAELLLCCLPMHRISSIDRISSIEETVDQIHVKNGDINPGDYIDEQEIRNAETAAPYQPIGIA